VEGTIFHLPIGRPGAVVEPGQIIAQELTQKTEEWEYQVTQFTPTSFIRLLILLHPQISGKALTENSRSLAWLERYAIAQHPNTPLHTLHTLAVDANCIVRAAAKARLQTRHPSQ
jgi:hypothetical protein